jgi:hypothetical protein
MGSAPALSSGRNKKKARIVTGPLRVNEQSRLEAALAGRRPAWTVAVVGLAQRPAGSLARAELAVGVDLPARAFEIDDDIEAMLAAAQTIPFGRPHLNFIHARPKSVTRPADKVVPLANFDIGLAWAISLQPDSHDPGTDALSLYDRIGGHVEILNRNAVAPATRAARLSARVGDEAGK